MSSLSGILSMAAGALTTHQKALATTSHNIANANTEGYSRQRAVLEARYPLNTPEGVIGTGVQIGDIERARDHLLDTSYRRESGGAAEHGERADYLSRLEQVLGEPSETGLMANLDAFWNSWSDLAADPLSDTARSVIRERATQLTDRMHQLSAGVQELREGAIDRLGALVERVNQLTGQVAELNGQIVTAESAGGTASDLRDQRDLALDELAGLAGARVIHRENGSVGVYLGGMAIVDGVRALEVDSRTETDASGDRTTHLIIKGRSTTLSGTSGKIGGLVEVMNGELARAQTDLNAFARSLVGAVNQAHNEGLTPPGLEDFFDPTALTADTIRVSDAVSASVGAIRAGTGDPASPNPTNGIALAMEGLRDDPPRWDMDGDGTIDPLTETDQVLAERFGELVSRTGAQVSAARSSHQVFDTLASQADLRRDAISGVSVDEELTNMIHQQAAYSAAARIVTRVDEMMQTLIGMV